jgi:hypothetical protein
MPIVITNNGELLALKALLNNTAGQNVYLRLYENDYTPVEASVTADFTEATFTGYAQKTLTGSDWTFTSGAPSDATGTAVQTFTSSAGSQDKYVYGYYYVQVTSGLCIAAERFSDGPYHIVNNGDAVAVTAKITAD